jgi:hypothetical protein
MAGNCDFEGLRRLRFGELRRLFRLRYGHTLPDDDAGCADLFELLLPASMRSSPEKFMRNVVEIWAPWMEAERAFDLVRQIETTPINLRMRAAKDLGERLNLTNHERERLGLRTIAAADMTDEQMAEWRRVKKNKRNRLYMQRARRKAGAKSRATPLSKRQPWTALNISRANWYRGQRVRQPVRQIRGQVNSYIGNHETVSPRLLRRKKMETVKGQRFSKKISKEERDEATITERDTTDCESKTTKLSHVRSDITTVQSKDTKASHDQASILPASICNFPVGCRVFIREIVPVPLGPPGDDMRDFR